MKEGRRGEGAETQPEGAPAANTADTAHKWNGIGAPLAVRSRGGGGKSRLLFPRAGEANNALFPLLYRLFPFFFSFSSFPFKNVALPPGGTR